MYIHSTYNCNFKSKYCFCLSDLDFLLLVGAKQELEATKTRYNECTGKLAERNRHYQKLQVSDWFLVTLSPGCYGTHPSSQHTAAWHVPVKF